MVSPWVLRWLFVARVSHVSCCERFAEMLSVGQILLVDAELSPTMPVTTREEPIWHRHRRQSLGQRRDSTDVVGKQLRKQTEIDYRPVNRISSTHQEFTNAVGAYSATERFHRCTSTRSESFCLQKGSPTMPVQSQHYQ